MSQPQYGRPPQAQYGYPPQGGPPPQQGPGRFYTPGPDAGIPSQPPQNGPQSFVYANQAPSSQAAQYPPGDSRIRPGNAPPSSNPVTEPYHHHRPQSTYDNPQELSTSTYASPTTNNPPPQFYPQHVGRQNTGGSEYSPSLYSPTDGEGHQQSQLPYPQQQAPTSSYAGGPPPSQLSAQPPYPNTPSAPHPTQNYGPPPSSSAPPPPSSSPGLGGNPYPTLNSGPPPANPGYQAYQPQGQRPGYAPPVDGGGNPNDFYR